MRERPADEALEGVIERFLFSSDDEGFSIAVLRDDGGVRTKAVGAMVGLKQGERVRLVGRREVSSKYGPQFRVEVGYPLLPHTEEGIRNYLSSGQVKGIGPTLAGRLVDAFGAETLKVIEHAPDRLREVEGIGPKRATEIKEVYTDASTRREAMLFLQGHGVTPALASRIWRRYEAQTIPIVRRNPYVLAEQVGGIGFATADRIARRMGFEADSPARAAAGLVHLLARAQDEGHVYLPREELLERAGRLLDEIAVAERVLAELLTEGRLVGEGERVYLRQMYALEVELTDRLQSLLAEPVVPLDARLDDFGRLSGLRLADAQRAAVEQATAAPVFVLTGGPGTGKTTIVRALLHALEQEGPVALAAPTGRAARRMAEATGHDAFTLHRLLEFSPNENGFRRDEDTPLEAAAVIIDEASMVDLPLAVALLRAVPPGTRLVFVGDADQLPSVGPGNVLGDLLASGVVPAVRLTEIFRQARTSRIVVNAHRVLAGEMVEAPSGESDFYLVRAGSSAEAAQLIETMVVERIPQRFGLDPVEDVQVLAPMHRGLCGTQQLNERLQARLNPEGAELPRGLRVGDKVMQVRNDYERDVFNGDLGRIAGVDAGGATVRFAERPVLYPLDDLDALVPAYACTVHKSQGSEYPAVVAPLLGEHWLMLQRNLLYTALTRGRRLVVLVAEVRALGRALRNTEGLRRYTALAERLVIG